MDEFKSGIVEGLNLPADILDVVNEWTTKGILDGEKLKMLSSAIIYFDTFVEKLNAKYERDIQEEKLTRKQVWIEGFNFITQHGHGVDDYRNNYIIRSLEFILESPIPLISIGTIVLMHAQLECHSQLYKKAQFIGKHDEIIEALEPEFRNKLQTEFIEALNRAYPEIKPETWKKRLQRFRSKETSGKLKRDKPD